MSTELDHVRAFRRSDGAPDDAARADARVVLLEQIAATAPQAASAAPRRRRLLVGALGLAASGLAAIALVAGLGSGGVQPATAAGVLGHAAVVAEQQLDPPVRPDQFWYTRIAEQQGDSRSIREDWVSLAGATRWVVHRDGMPDEVHPKDRQVVHGQPTFTYSPQPLTRDEVLALPTDADALYDEIERAGLDWARTNLLPAADAPHEMFAIVGDWLRMSPPLPSTLRAALYRVAARLPGIELLGEERDVRGREGVAVALTSDGVQSVLVFDPDTSRLLGDRVVRASDGYVLYRRTALAAGIVDSPRERPEP